MAEAYLHAKFHLGPSNCLATVHERYRQRNGTDRTDRQRSDSIGRTVLQTVAQKLSHSHDAFSIIRDVIQWNTVKAWHVDRLSYELQGIRHHYGADISVPLILILQQSESVSLWSRFSLNWIPSCENPLWLKAIVWVIGVISIDFINKSGFRHGPLGIFSIAEANYPYFK